MNKRKNHRPMSVITMGCRVNQFETELLRHGGHKRGFYIAKEGDKSELIIVNTCSVTSESDRQARQAIRRAAKDNPEAKIVITGCYAQRTPEILSKLPQVALVLGNQEKNDLWSHVDRLFASHSDNNGEQTAVIDNIIDGGVGHSIIHVGDIAKLEKVPPRPVVDSFSDRARAFLQLQDGCNRSCTYCLIPGVRGPSRSLTPEQILAQAEGFVVAGYNELVLTGIDLGSYGQDFSPKISLADIIKKLIEIPGLGRVRLSSIDPLDIDSQLIDLIGSEEKICPYLHLSIQSGDNMILKRMGRRADRNRIIKQINKVKQVRPNIILGADLIVGFPTESDEAFQNSLTLVEETQLVYLHIFRYSDRPGTPASAIPGSFRSSGVTIKERSEILRKAGEQNLTNVAKNMLGQRQKVLIETLKDGVGIGKTASFMTVSFPLNGDEVVGKITDIIIDKFDIENRCLKGTVQELSTALSTKTVDKM
ncbi:MAG: tRNA (N(6)-L-threonylcarbamoyladenosine(37)-C(2))-methylthiotransferase MtaB [Magnetococcales bacterium]|nr:tRNA (N(6)-L-threonylcarbamoyladenosine(37)-C(2))-methylthiotransferase MtaB [Magnetococcales bacterium]